MSDQTDVEPAGVPLIEPTPQPAIPSPSQPPGETDAPEPSPLVPDVAPPGEMPLGD